MKRSSFLRTLFTVAISPKVLSEINFSQPPISSVAVNASLFKDLQLLTPSYYKKYVEKYGNEDYAWILKELGKNGNTGSQQFHYFQTNNVGNSSIEPGSPVTVKIQKIITTND